MGCILSNSHLHGFFKCLNKEKFENYAAILIIIKEKMAYAQTIIIIKEKMAYDNINQQNMWKRCMALKIICRICYMHAAQ
jgi:hypothetical protein